MPKDTKKKNRKNKKVKKDNSIEIDPHTLSPVSEKKAKKAKKAKTVKKEKKGKAKKDKTVQGVVGSVDVEDNYGRRTETTVLENHRGFDLENVVVYDYEGKVSGTQERVRFFDSRLQEFISDAASRREYYGEQPTPSLQLLMGDRQRFKAYIPNWECNDESDNHYTIRSKKEPITDLIEYLAERDAKRIAQYESMLERGVILYDYLDMYFQKNAKIGFSTAPNREGAVVNEGEYRSTFFGSEFRMTVSRYASDGQHFGKIGSHVSISAFNDAIPISDLPAQILDEEEMREMSIRGANWAKMILSPKYLQFTGKMLIPTWMGDIPMSATGRCMIDTSMFRQMSSNTRDLDRIDGDENETIPEDFLFTTPAFVHGFSMKQKSWGKFPLSGLDEIAFRDDAYDLLVLDQETKKEVRALVENSEDMFTDLISGKGGGAIFLLHGPPGLGKTLTAESVAEILHRPLYSISVGELGITPGEVEETLKNVLEMVTSWNAVLLLDEADIFLEARTKDDITRNAMVGVFLRLLEYHNGVLFLTTNRVANFDDAFMSRISVIIQYPEFTPEVRKMVWTNILFSAGMADAGVDIDHMAVTYEINGRQIKNAIRIAMSLAAADGKPCDQYYIEKVVKRNVQVISDIVAMGAGADMSVKAPVDKSAAAA